VDQEGIFLDRPSLEYRSLPPLTTDNATIDIEKNETEFRRLLASLTGGKGASDWFEDRPVDPKATYTATPDFRDEDNTPLPAVTKKLPVTRLPLTAETRDRQLEVRFAVPAGSDRRYVLKIYVAPENVPLSQTPSLTLPWSIIQSAYESEDTVFADITPSSAKASDPYVIRKIKRVVVPGSPPIKEQNAFALDAILGGYHHYGVSLVEEGPSGRELTRVEGQASPDLSWAGMLDDLTSIGLRTTSRWSDGRVRLARTGLMPLFQIAPYQVWGPQAGLVARVILPIERMLGLVKDAYGNIIQPSFPYQLVRGLVNGFIDGFEGDKQLILHPIDSFHAMKDGIAEFIKVIRSGVLLDGWLQGVYNALPQAMGSKVSVLGFLDGANRVTGKIGFIEGYVAGMVLWQVASALVLAAAVAGVGAVIEKVAAVAKATGLTAAISARVARALAVLGRVASLVADQIRAGEAVEEIARIASAIFEIADGPLAVLAAKYAQAMKTLDPALKLMARSASLGRKVIEVFARVAALPDEAAVRLISYLGRGEGTVAKVAHWIDIYNNRTLYTGGMESARAIREALEGAPDIPNGITDEVFEALVAAADKINKADGTGADNLVATFVQKHRNPGLPAPPGPIATEQFMRALLEAPDGIKISQRTINDLIRIHSEAGLPAWSKDALTGAARFIERNADEGAALLERFVREVAPESLERVDVVLAKLRGFSDPDNVKAFARLVKDGEARRMATIVDNITYDGIQEKLVNAINRLRKPEDGPLIPGIATTPQGPPAPLPPPDSLLDTMVNAPNKGTAYEPVATLRLVERGDLTVDGVVEMGRRFRATAADGSASILEADTFAVASGKRVSIDFKHSASAGDAVIDSDLLGRIDRALRNPETDFDEWWFAVQGNVPASKYFEIQGINAELMSLFPGRYPTEPIKIIEQLGDF
jgi:hypothetical protein